MTKGHTTPSRANGSYRGLPPFGFLSPAFSLGLVLVLGAGQVQGQTPTEPPALAQATHPAPLLDLALGNPKAKLTLVEYASPTCPHCSAWYTDVYPVFKAKYVDTGKVRYIFRELPTAPVEVANAGFLLMRCAPEDKAFDVLHSLFDGQSTLRFTKRADIMLYNAGAAGGLSRAQTEACLADKPLLARIAARIETNVAKDHVEYTPTFFLNGVRIGEGELALKDLEKQLNRALAGKSILPVASKASAPAKPHARNRS